MPLVLEKCRICGKTAETRSQFNIGGTIMLSLKCGHQIKQEHLQKRDAAAIKALNGHRLMPFQIKGVEHVETAGGRALIADEMGLGKTVQALSFLFLHPEAMPAMGVVKASLLTQWQRQFANWCSNDHDDGYRFAQIISSSKDVLLPGLPFYIVSFDLIRRFNSKEKDRTGHFENRLVEMAKARGIKTLIIDECQQIKNNDSQRTEEVRKLARICDNVIALSGTPIKNNAGEYFPILNMIQPERFPKYSQFLMQDVCTSWNGYGAKVGGLEFPEAFKSKTQDFIIRRERKEVLPELPLVSRQFMFNDLGGKVEQAYIDEFKRFRDEYNAMGEDKDFSDNGNILAYLSRMRHLTGYAKIDPCIDFCVEFLGSTDDDRLCIFVHHVDVAQLLQQKLAEICRQLELSWTPVNLVSMNPAARELKKDQWIASNSRILILSTLASGEGLDGLQKVCHKMVTLEREWNPANEEQVEGRFSRIGQEANSIDNTFFVAVGTVDEFFAEIVEKKREIVTSTMGGEAVEWNQTSIIMELAEILAMNGGKKWGI